MTALERFHRALGDDFTRVSPRGSGRPRTLEEVVLDLGERLVGSDLADAPAGGRCSVFGDVSRFHDDAAWYDALFYEYFRGDSGAADRTGWIGLVADLVVHLSRARESRASS